MSKKRLAVMIFIFLFAGVALLVYNGQRTAKRSELYYSGTIEATRADLSFQTGGRVIRVDAGEGDTVEKGQLLALLDDSELKARIRQAEANVEKAKHMQRQLEMMLEVYENTIPAEVTRAEAAVLTLASQLDELKSGNRPQDVERARQTYLAAKAVMEENVRNRDRYKELFQREVISEREWDSVKLKYETAYRDYERSSAAYDLAKEGARKETIETAQARLAEGKAALVSARSNVKKIDAARREIEAAKSQVAAAEAGLSQARIQSEYTELKAPFSGTLTGRNVEPGEVVTAGREVLTLTVLSTVKMNIFVGEEEIGKVKPQQEAEVKVDSFPDKIFKGRVTFISSEGEFTPKIIQTHKERVKLVYKVEIAIPNQGFALKTGMPADAWLR